MLPGLDARPLRKEFARLLQRAVSPFMGAFLLSKTAAAARSAIGAAPAGSYAAAGTNNDITSLTALTAGGLPDNSVLTADIANGQVTPAKLSQPPTLGTSVATTSGTAIDITGIPSWVNKVSVLFNGISTAGAASGTLLQLGTSGGVVNTGYTSTCVSSSATNTVVSFASTAGLAIQGGTVAESFIGVYELRRFSGNTWIGFISGNRSGNGWSGGGTITLGGALDRIRLTNANGTDTFDAGSINVMYE